MVLQTYLSKEMIAEMVDIVRDGNYEITAARVLGIPKGTFESWMYKGRAQIKNGATPEDSIYVELVTRLHAASAEAEVDMVEVVRSEPQGDRWLIARRFRRSWGDKLEVSVSKPIVVKVVYEPRPNSAPTAPDAPSGGDTGQPSEEEGASVRAESGQDNSSE